MAKPRVLILRAPGTNCDAETAFAFETAGAQTNLIHINQLLDAPNQLRDYQIVCIPGGFSYGDDIAAGRILSSQILNHLSDLLHGYQAEDRLTLGICNGFQVMLKAGMLIPADDRGPVATLTWNDSGKFEDRWVHLGVSPSKCVFLQGLETIFLPVAHAEGRFVCRSSDELGQLDRANQLVMRYANPSADDRTVGYPANPNGAMANVAGVCDSSGRAFGLMPHPERYLNPTQHPSWTRSDRIPESGEGLRIFQNAVSYFA